MATENQDQIFIPFQPGTPNPPAQPSQEQPSPPKQRRKRKVAAVNPPADPAPRQKRQKAPRAPRGLKLPVGTMFAVMAELKADDGPLFEKLLGVLNAAGSGQRQRVLAALSKVFA